MNPLPKTDTKFKLPETGPGWDGIVQPLVKECEKMGGEVLQVKEELGALKFLFDLPGDLRPELITHFHRLVKVAEEKSVEICEMCGLPGTLRVSGKKTLCDRDAEIRQRRMGKL